jgi:hypothetical protein
MPFPFSPDSDVARQSENDNRDESSKSARVYRVGAEFLLDGVAVRESGAEALEDGVRHRSIRCDFGYDRARAADATDPHESLLGWPPRLVEVILKDGLRLHGRSNRQRAWHRR